MMYGYLFRCLEVNLTYKYLGLGLEKPYLISIFGFGWENTLRRCFSGKYMSFLLILVGFLEKGMKSIDLGNFEVLCHGVGIPRSNVSPRQGVACPRHGTAKREAWTSLRYTEA